MSLELSNAGLMRSYVARNCHVKTGIFVHSRSELESRRNGQRAIVLRSFYCCISCSSHFHVVTRVRFIKYDNEVTDRQTDGIVIPISRSV